VWGKIHLKDTRFQQFNYLWDGLLLWSCPRKENLNFIDYENANMRSDTQDDVYQRLQSEINKLPILYPETDTGSEIKLIKYLFSPEH